MTLLLKDPEAVLDYLVDWGAEYLGEDAIADSQWQVSPVEAGGVAVVDSRFDDGSATVQAGGGVAGRVYQLVNQVTTASGRVDRRSVTLRVEAR